MEIRFLGHAAFQLSDGDTNVLIDPFLSGNPKAAAAADEVEASAILVTHGHGDHIGDTVAIAKRTGAPVVAVVELANELAAEGVEVFDPNLGGTVSFDWGWVKFLPAWHTSNSPSGTVSIASGVLVSIGDMLIYHLGDTCLFSDLKLVTHRGRRPDVALVPIGGHYTMDRYDAVTAVELIEAQTVIPMHYDTFPAIETDAQAFKADVEGSTSSKVAILEPGETHRP